MIEISSGNYKNSRQHAGLLTLNFPRMLFHDSGHTSWIRRGNTSLYLNTPRLTSINMTAPWPFEYWTFQECYCMTLATEVVWTTAFWNVFLLWNMFFCMKFRIYQWNWLRMVIPSPGRIYGNELWTTFTHEFQNNLQQLCDLQTLKPINSFFRAFNRATYISVALTIFITGRRLFPSFSFL